MSEVVPVVKIKPSHESQGAFVEINESDFDPNLHELYEPGSKAPADSDDTAALTKREICADLEAMGVDYDARTKVETLLALRNEARAARDA